MGAGVPGLASCVETTHQFALYRLDAEDCPGSKASSDTCVPVCALLYGWRASDQRERLVQPHAPRLVGDRCAAQQPRECLGGGEREGV